MKMLRIAVLLLFTFLLNAFLFGLNIRFENKIRLSNKVLLQFPISFSVTEDNLFLVVDFKGRDVKIYRNNGELLKVLGQKGFGPNEFGQPLFCHYSNGKFVISDVGQKRIFIYDRKDKFNFERKREILCTNVGDHLHLKENKLYISGIKRNHDGEPYGLYVTDLGKDNHWKYFLPAHLKFGFTSAREYNNVIFKKPDLSAIGTFSKFDIHGDFAYYIWEGDLRIFKINLKTKETTTFGEKMSHYVKPYASKKLIEAFKNRMGKNIIKEKRKMSYVKHIFTTQKHVLLIYAVPGKENEEPRYMMQFYTLEGNFVKEVEVPGKLGMSMCPGKTENVLYSIISEPDEEIGEEWYILKHKLSE